MGSSKDHGRTSPCQNRGQFPLSEPPVFSHWGSHACTYGERMAKGTLGGLKGLAVQLGAQREKAGNSNRTVHRDSIST